MVYTTTDSLNVANTVTKTLAFSIAVTSSCPELLANYVLDTTKAGYVALLSAYTYYIGVDSEKQFTIPSFKFTVDHFCGEKETLTMLKTDGTALPSWVGFNSITRVVTINTTDKTKNSTAAENYRITSTLSGGAVKTIDWTLTLTDPCAATTITAMTISTIIVAIGGTQT